MTQQTTPDAHEVLMERLELAGAVIDRWRTLICRDSAPLISTTDDVTEEEAALQSDVLQLLAHLDAASTLIVSLAKEPGCPPVAES